MNRSLRLLTFVLLVFLAGRVSQGAGPLRFKWNVGQTFAYEVEIEVDLSDKIDTYKGAVFFEVKGINGDMQTLAYRGGVKGSSVKAGTQEPAKPSSFNLNHFKGLQETTGELVISTRGQVGKTPSPTQLPYMLGNLTLLFFEDVPEGALKTWKLDGGVAISEKEETTNNTGRGNAGKGGAGRGIPSGRPGRGEVVTTEKTKPASQTESFEIKTDAKGQVAIQKTTVLKSPGEDESLTVEGKGRWTFNRQLGVSESLDFSHQMVVVKGNTTFTIPVKLKYHLLNEQELAKYEEERDQLTSAERENTVKALAPGSNLIGVKMTMESLKGKSPSKTDEVLVKALEPWTKHDDPYVSHLADLTIVTWTPEQPEKGDEVRWRGGLCGIVGWQTPPKRPVTNETRLFPGQLVAARVAGTDWKWGWFPGDIVELKPDGNVLVRLRRHQPDKSEYTFKRADLDLPPDPKTKLSDPKGKSTKIAASTKGNTAIGSAPSDSTKTESPKKEETASATGTANANPVLRTWSDSTGTFKIEAEMKSFTADKVTLRRQDGREVTLSLSQLSAADQEFVKQQAKSPKNPFDP